MENGLWLRPRLVARIRPPCQVAMDLLMDWVDLISRFYGRCILVPEINKDGAYTIREARRRGIPVYKETAIDPVTERKLENWGFRTTEGTRREIIDHLARSIRDVQDPSAKDALEIYDPHAVKELSTFVLAKSGRPEAAAGCHDDDVMGLAIGYYCLPAATPYVVGATKVQPVGLLGTAPAAAVGGGQQGGGSKRVGRW
jgi:hypothetical protein